jgi:galactokinase
VNLIGDHTDYSGLPVLPMAIQRECRILMRPSSDEVVRLANVRSEFPRVEFELSDAIDPYLPGSWGNYAKAAGQALATRLRRVRGFDGVVTSDIPIAAGLSSSSSLVIATALAILRASSESLDPLDLADIMAEGERYVGTRGGGMDQAICLSGRSGSAIRIDFNPLRLTPVRIPGDWRFIVAYSLGRAPKAAEAKEVYNRRVDECRRAADILADELGIVAGPALYARLIARISEEDLLFAAGSGLDDLLHKRFRHVVTEARRVEQAQEAMIAADERWFGELMSESHYSLRDDFEVSNDALDRLVEIALDAGALGARLTGAGLGGCVVVLSESSQASQVLDALTLQFYDKTEFAGALSDQRFVAEPSGGATVIALD